MAHVNYIHNIPFISIFLTMFGGIITPLFSNGKIAQKINLIIVCIVGVLSAILLGSVWQNKESFTYKYGNYYLDNNYDIAYIDANLKETKFMSIYKFKVKQTIFGYKIDNYEFQHINY